MPKVLTRLRIDEVSAVDRGAGDGVKIVLMKRADDTPRSKPHVERHARQLRKSQAERDQGRSFNAVLARMEMAKLADDKLDRRNDGDLNAGASDHHASKVADLLVESGRFPHRTAALDHLLNTPHGQALLSRMSKKETTPMKDTVDSIMKDCGGPVTFAKTIRDTGRSYGVSSEAYVAAASRHESELRGIPGDRAFAKLCEEEPDVLRACAVLKAAEFAVFDIEPVVVGGTDAQDVDNATAAVRAYEEIVRIGREKFPFLGADQQFSRVFQDSKYEVLARQAHQRPGPSTVYAMPKAVAYTKSDPVPNTDTAYAELMLKAEAYRTANPELSIAQCFAEIYTDRANVELAKRERVESRPR